MKITVDTNILLRAVVQDDVEQAAEAQALLLRAAVIAVPVPVFCEFACVLKRTYARGADDIAAAIEAIAGIAAVATDLAAVEADLPSRDTSDQGTEAGPAVGCGGPPGPRAAEGGRRTRQLPLSRALSSARNDWKSAWLWTVTAPRMR